MFPRNAKRKAITAAKIGSSRRMTEMDARQPAEGAVPGRE
jgi:hypothetical protein